MTDNITLPRKHIDYAAHALEHFNKDAPDPLVSEIIHYLRTALAAPCLEVTVDPRLTPDEAAAISSALAATKQELVAYFDLQKQVFFWAKPTQIDVPMTVALKPLPLYAAAAAPRPEPQECWCHKCNSGRLVDYMIVCPICGCKRCPKASDHELTCISSNESGQPGSVYAPPAAAPRLEVTVDPRLTPDEAAAISSALAAEQQQILDEIKEVKP